MIALYGRELRDVLTGGFLNSVTILTIALSILIVSAFGLSLINADALLTRWAKDIRIMAYLEKDLTDADIERLKLKIERLQGIGPVIFVSRETALSRLKAQMKRQSSLIDDLRENPLPDSFEIQMGTAAGQWEIFESLAGKIEAFSGVDEVEYGQKWLGRFLDIYNLFRITGYAMAALFVTAAVFFVGNTIRLALYSRREEIRIMRLVGASDGFIKNPFYIRSLLQGGFGGAIGLGVLYLLFTVLSGSIGTDPSTDWFRLIFLPWESILGILAGSMMIGWFGCYLSLRNFLRSDWR